MPTLAEEEAHFAIHLKPIHEQVKLATLGTSGAIILFVQARLSAEAFGERLALVGKSYADARSRLAAIDPPSVASDRWQAYLAAIGEAHAAVGALRGLSDPSAVEQIRPLMDRVAASHQRMQELGWTFWYPEYLPSGSEGSPANPHWHG